MKNVSIVIFTLAIFPSAWTELTVGPNNVTVQVNRSTYMNCSTTSEKGVKWFHNGATVCAGLRCYDPYKQRFHVENISSTGSWNLIISSVKAEDGGDYRCEEIGFVGYHKSAQLTVLELEETETTDVGLRHTTAASDTDTTAAAVVTITAGTIAAIICGLIVGIAILIIIIVYVVRKFRLRRQKTKKEIYELRQQSVRTTSNDEQQQLIAVGLPAVSSEHQQQMSLPTTSSEHQQQMSVPTTSNKHQPPIEDDDYFDQPILIKTIKTRIAEKNNSYVRAASIFNDEVFLATDNSPEIEVYNVVNLDLKRRFTVDRLINPLDIKPCLVNNCLYIFDCEYVGQPGKMLKIDREGNILAEWPMEDSGARLAVASNGNFIVSLTTNEKIVEYTTDGTQVREIKVSGLCHTIPLEINRRFLISQGYLDQSELHRVFQVLLEDGETNVKVETNSVRIIKAFGGERGSSVDEMNVPWYMAVDENGWIFVAERENQRVTLFSPTLKLKKILISENDGLRRPLNMFMDIPRGRLFVTDFKWKQTDRVDGKLMVFQIRN